MKRALKANVKGDSYVSAETAMTVDDFRKSIIATESPPGLEYK
jgi:hypothetical protein